LNAAGTARLVAKVRDEIAGGAPLLPKDIVDRLANGGASRASVAKMARHHADVPLLRDKSKPGHISDIENGRRTGTAAALRLIANVLKVPLDLLVQEV